MRLSGPDKEIFHKDGLLVLRGFVSSQVLSAAQNSISLELKRLKIKVNGKIASTMFRDLPVFQQIGRVSCKVKAGAELDRLFSNDLHLAMNHLAGTQLTPAQARPQLLLSLPHKEKWTLNNLNWHLDLSPPKEDRIIGVQAFVLIDDVKPQGGATLALAGSHKLHYLRHGHNAHDILRQTPEFASEPEKFLKTQKIQGIETKIVEMSGRAGDVYLMDLRILHSPSINASRDIRMMATNRFLTVL